jgi:hypothetical protein
MATIAKYSIKTIDDKDKISQFNYPALPSTSIINDARKLTDFKLATIGGYPRGKVSSAIDKCITQQKIEEAIYWTFQLLASGAVDSLFDKLLAIAAKNVNIYNPHLPDWLFQKTVGWHSITSNERYKKDNVLNLRNHPTIRNMLTELVVITSLSKPRKLEALPKIGKEDFIVSNFNAKLECKDFASTHHIFKDEDPREIKVASNEIAFHLLNGNIVRALYWLNWVLTWETLNIKKYTKYDCALRGGAFFDSKSNIPPKCNRNVIWLIWSIVENMANKRFSSSANLQVAMRSLWELFIMNYTSGCRNRRLVYLIWAMSYLCNPIDWSIPLISESNQTTLFVSLLKNDKIASRILASTVAPMANPVNAIVENNYAMPPAVIKEERPLAQAKYKSMPVPKQAALKKGALSEDSQEKLSKMNQLDKYLETTIFT